MQDGSLSSALRAAGDAATFQLLERLDPEDQVHKLQELLELSSDLSFENRPEAAERYTRYLCAAVAGFKEDRWTAFRFETLSRAYAKLSVRHSYNIEAKVWVVRHVLGLWITLRCQEEVADDIFRWIVRESIRDSNIIATKVLEMLRDPNFSRGFQSSTLERAILIICNEFGDKEFLVSKLLQSLGHLWFGKMISIGHQPPFEKIRKVIEMSCDLSD